MNTLNAAAVAAAMAVTAISGAAAQAPPVELRPGDVAPAFTLPGSDGRTYSLADYKGVKPVVLAWFPRTPIKD